MIKNIASMLVGAIICAAVGTAFAVTGQPPGTGFGLIDGAWLNALAGGQNFASQYGITAVGTNQATSFQLPSNYALLEVDTAGAGGATGVALPACLQGTQLSLLDNTAYTIDVYPSITNNPVTNAQDTIDNGTSTTLTTYARATFTCAKNGVWIK